MKSVTLDFRVPYAVFGVPKRSRNTQVFMLQEVVQVDVPVVDQRDATTAVHAIVTTSHSEEHLLRYQWENELYEPISMESYRRGLSITTIDQARAKFMANEGAISALRMSYYEPLWSGKNVGLIREFLPLDLATVTGDLREASIERAREIFSDLVFIGGSLCRKSEMPLMSLEVWRTDGGRLSAYQRHHGERSFTFGLDRLPEARRITNAFGINLEGKLDFHFVTYPSKEMLDTSSEAVQSTRAGIRLTLGTIEEVFADLSGEGMATYASLLNLSDRLRHGDRSAVHSALDQLEHAVESRFDMPTMPDRVYARVRRAYALTHACVTSARDFENCPRAPEPDQDESLSALGL